MRNEILRIITPKPVFAAAPTAICLGSRATFSVQSECPRAGQPTTTYAWTPGSGLSIVSGRGTANVVVEASAGYTGTVTLQVVAPRTGFAASPLIQANAYVGPAVLNVTEDPAYGRGLAAAKPEPPAPNYSCSKQVYLLADAFNVALPYTATLTTYRNTGPTTSTQTVTSDHFYITVYDFDVDVVLSGASTCGGGPVTSDAYRVLGCYNPLAAQRPAAYPNPADAVLTLAAPETREAAAPPRTAVLYNAQGREVRRNAQATEAHLATAGLPAGLYYLVVEQGGKVSRSQIRVQH